ncbi:DnaD domain protein [Romboutsia weinsteinii]|uniref:DnaD domain protein n=1 Tax=Romboutsia weinsteinii TaxID=2020949 RepID=A0A371J218_9FIRM|nr:DnaD domain protein [Romboutsia weinsteinii]RDY26708.1 DnaD domain protein [Romboutsia weinsteinii]
MAIYRQVHINYWQDGFVLDLTPEEKYFYIYIMTNSKTSQCGIYELPKRIIETETGYNRETIEKLITRFEDYKKVIYCKDTREIFIKNWIKHNKVVSPKVKKCIEKEIRNIKSKDLLDLFYKECNKYGYDIEKVDIDDRWQGADEVKDNDGGQDKKPEQSQDRKLEQSREGDDISSQVTDNNKEEHNEKLGKMSKLYEANVGLINGVVGEWLIEVSESFDVELFKKAIEIATDNGKCNRGYINGILNTWRSNKVSNYEEYKAYVVGLKKREASYGRDNSKSKYARELENEDETIYQKPSDEQIRAVRELCKGE